MRKRRHEVKLLVQPKVPQLVEGDLNPQSLTSECALSDSSDVDSFFHHLQQI